MCPSIAIQIRSLPRGLTRTLAVTRENIPITDITSDEAGIGELETAAEILEPSLKQEVVMLTQRQLTPELEVAEMNNLRVEAEVRQRRVEQEVSKEIYMFNQARALTEDMRMNFTVEDQR